MPDAQNAFLFPSPVSQQIYQAKPSHKPIKSDFSSPGQDGAGAAVKDAHDKALFAPFFALLNQAVSRADDDPKPLLALLEEYTANLPAGEGDNGVFSKPVWDLMASLKNDFENKDDVNDALEIGLGMISDWDLKAVEAVLSKLRDRRMVAAPTAAAPMENDGPRDMDFKTSLPDYLRFGVETVSEDMEHPKGDSKMNVYALPVMDGQHENGEKIAVDQAIAGQTAAGHALEQPQTTTRLQTYLKSDASKEVTAEANESSDEQPLLSKYSNVTALNAGEEPHDEFSGDLRNREEKPGSDQRKEDVPARFEPKQAVRTDKNANENEPRAKTNFTENRATFEQFFEHAMARRDAAGTYDATAHAQTHGLDLAKGFSLSQGQALRDGLDNVIRFIRISGEQKAVLTVDPPALGRVSVELTSGATGLEASVKVSSEQVRQLIQEHLTQLKFSLEQQGVQLTHFSVDVQQDNARGNQGGNTRRRQNARGVDTSEEDGLDEVSGFQVDLNEGLLYWIA